MKILESPLLGEFIAYLKANWSDRSRVDLRRRRLRQLVTKVRAVTDAAESRGGAAVRGGSLAAWLHMLRAEALRGQQVLDASCCDAAAVAGSTRRFLSGIKGLVVSSADVDRLTDAVEELERLVGPGGDLDLFVKVLRLDDAQAATAMDVDGWPDAASGGSSSSSSADSVLPVPGVKRKRACCSSGAPLPGPGVKRKLPCCSSGAALPGPGVKRKLPCCSSGADAGPTSLGQLDTIDHRKRRVLGWLPTFGVLFAAHREPPPRPPHPHSARTVALAMARVRRRIGKPTRRRRQHTLGQQLLRMSL